MVLLRCFLNSNFQRTLKIETDLFPFIVSLVLLGIQVSYFLVITVGVLAICFPIAIKLNRRAGLAYYLASLKADRRLKLTNELLQGMFCTILWSYYRS
jgi:hypothetical protein